MLLLFSLSSLIMLRQAPCRAMPKILAFAIAVSAAFAATPLLLLPPPPPFTPAVAAAFAADAIAAPAIRRYAVFPDTLSRYATDATVGSTRSDVRRHHTMPMPWLSPFSIDSLHRSSRLLNGAASHYDAEKRVAAARKHVFRHAQHAH